MVYKADTFEIPFKRIMLYINSTSTALLTSVNFLGLSGLLSQYAENGTTIYPVLQQARMESHTSSELSKDLVEPRLGSGSAKEKLKS